ncbi:acyltransferase family protein [Yeosuana marina]|uniref:acyltransferase family protein n=1 Tax=Yeosuana marina TaxID=1565536 RepID=UPI0014222731|nr:acyltransferase [Yeosuana marina]
MKETKIKSPVFLGYLHSFRALAILKIVLGHAVAAAFIAAYGAFNDTAPIIMISEIFYHDSTIYFAIISGLLFSRVLKPKGYNKFYISKLKNIVLPYIFVTLVLTFIKIKFDDVANFQEGISYYASKVFKNIIFGKANFALWYIPVLIVLYIVTPVLEFLQKTNTLTKVFFFFIMIIPLFVSRIQVLTEYTLKIETMLYFIGAYAVGMYLGSDLERKLQLIKRYKYAIITAVVICTIILFYFYSNKINMMGKVSLRESVFYIQKIGLALVFIMLFKRLGDRQPKWLVPIARDSFSIYFIHGTVLYAISHFFMFIVGAKAIAPLNIVLGAFLLLVVSISISMIIVYFFKKVFGKKSRMIIGS